jgi:hypothetical protein
VELQINPVLKTGLNIAGDVVQERNIKQAAEARLKSTGQNLFQKGEFFSFSTVKCHHHSSSFEWDYKPRVVPYIYFHGLKSSL